MEKWSLGGFRDSKVSRPQCWTLILKTHMEPLIVAPLELGHQSVFFDLGDNWQPHGLDSEEFVISRVVGYCEICKNLRRKITKTYPSFGYPKAPRAINFDQIMASSFLDGRGGALEKFTPSWRRSYASLIHFSQCLFQRIFFSFWQK